MCAPSSSGSRSLPAWASLSHLQSRADLSTSSTVHMGSKPLRMPHCIDDDTSAEKKKHHTACPTKHHMAACLPFQWQQLRGRWVPAAAASWSSAHCLGSFRVACVQRDMAAMLPGQCWWPAECRSSGMGCTSPYRHQQQCKASPGHLQLLLFRASASMVLTSFGAAHPSSRVQDAACLIRDMFRQHMPIHCPSLTFSGLHNQG